ncbi:MAG: DUF924 domain-containing protein [Hyphomicrobiaceae bacterium]|nr:DUF924 domain-containing protein [Hyphomicrobiaceae bacterium]
MTQDDLPEEAGDVLRFWFGVLEPEQWWLRDDAIDQEIKTRFAALYLRLSDEVPQSWLASPQGRLAAVIVLDQFPRNMFRDDPRAYASDPAALKLARETIASGDDEKLAPEQRSFLYMPYQHSEDPSVQEESLELFRSLGDAVQLDYAEKHKQVIDRFGRFPHRNKVLGRKTTAVEKLFLKEPGLFW